MEQKNMQNSCLDPADLNIQPLSRRDLQSLKGTGAGGRDPWPVGAPAGPPPPDFCSCATPMGGEC